MYGFDLLVFGLFFFFTPPPPVLGIDHGLALRILITSRNNGCQLTHVPVAPSEWRGARRAERGGRGGRLLVN